MTKEEARKAAEVMLAYANGEEIEIAYSNGSCQTVTSPEFNWGKVEYRVKSEPKYRPFKSQEECWEEMLKHQPFGWIKRINGNDLCSISSVNCGGITTLVYYRFSKSFEKFTFIDGTPFGIKEE